MPRSKALSEVGELLKREQVAARAKIQAGKIIERVGKIAAGEVQGDAALLGVQLRASELLLRKALPDLSSVEMTGEAGGPLTITINKVT